jgi:hypothetical protein
MFFKQQRGQLFLAALASPMLWFPPTLHHKSPNIVYRANVPVMPVDTKLLIQYFIIFIGTIVISLSIRTRPFK